MRAKARSVEQAYASLEATLLRTPTDAEVAAELDISEQDLQDILRQISFVGVAALDEVFLVGGDRSERTTLGDTIPDAAAGPVAMFEDKESKEILSQAIMQLGDRERTVLVALLLRRSDPGRDRGDPRGHREPGLPDPHQGRPAAPGPAERPDHARRDGPRPGAGPAAGAGGPSRAWPATG